MMHTIYKVRHGGGDYSKRLALIETYGNRIMFAIIKQVKCLFSNVVHSVAVHKTR